MKITLVKNDRVFEADLSRGVSIAIDLSFETKQPCHFGVAAATREPVVAGEFIGRTRRGGSCNVDRINFVPHCNGTHTESVGHLVDDQVPVSRLAKQSIFLARLISVVPAETMGADSYSPSFYPGDTIVTSQLIQEAIDVPESTGAEALIVRTLPNDDSKTVRQYDEEYLPPYFSCEAMDTILDWKVDHLLVDVPSIDRIYDEGRLSNHRKFWNLTPDQKSLDADSNVLKTITEMIFVPDQLPDGMYLLNLQFAAFESDASPSRPILFPVTQSES